MRFWWGLKRGLVPAHRRMKRNDQCEIQLQERAPGVFCKHSSSVQLMPRVPEEGLWEFSKKKELCVYTGEGWIPGQNVWTHYGSQYSVSSVALCISFKPFPLCLTRQPENYVQNMLAAAQYLWYQPTRSTFSTYICLLPFLLFLFHPLFHPSGSTDNFLLPDSYLWFNSPSFSIFSLWWYGL